MKKISKNVGAFEKLLGICNNHGSSFDPSNPAIGSTALRALLEEVQKSITAVQIAKNELALNINLRQQVFEKLPNIASGIVQIAKAGGMSEHNLDDLIRLSRKFRSQPFDGTGDSSASEGKTEAPKPVRFNRQLSFVMKQQSFAEMVDFLEREQTGYHAKEPGYRIEDLKQLAMELHGFNTSVDTASAQLQSAKRSVEKLVYSKVSGIYGIVSKVKAYFRGMHGLKSAAYKEVSLVKVSNK